jgi:uncharacterized protein (TIRG00374 family)
LRKYIVIAIKLLVLGLLLVWIANSFSRDDWNALVQQKKNWGLLAISLVVVLGAHVLSFLRWHVFVQALQVPFTMTEAVRLGFLGNLFNFVSLGAVGGDLFKAIAAARQAGRKRPEIIASVLVDRALGLLGLVIVAAVSLQIFSGSLSNSLDWIRRGAWVFASIGIGSLALIAFAGHRLPVTWLSRIPGIGHTLHRMASAGMLFEGKPILVMLLVGMSCAVHMILTFGMYLVSIALYANAPSLTDHFLTVPTSFAVAALPLTPGGVGVQEMALSKMFEELPNLPEGFSGLIVAAMYRLETIVVAAVGGIYYVLGANEINKLKKEAEQEANQGLS